MNIVEALIILNVFYDIVAKHRVKQQNLADFLPDELVIALGERPPPWKVGLSTRLPVPNHNTSTVCSY